MGFYKPTTTQTPDALFDYWQTRLTGAEMRVLLYAVRRTYGFKKDNDNISLDQFEHGISGEDGEPLDEGCGVSRKSILRAIKLLADKGLLTKTRRHDDDNRDEVSNFRLHIVDQRQPRPERGFRRINTTQVPDELFDYWLPRLSDAELFILLYIVRRTLGFHKATDIITPQQYLSGVRTRLGTVLDEGCGVSKKHLYRALGGLKDKGLIAIQRRRSRRAGNIASVFSLVFDGEVPDILAASPDDVDPRASAYDVRADPDLAAMAPAPSAAWPGGPAGHDGEDGNRAAEGRKKTPRGAHGNHKREASGHLDQRVGTPREAREEDKRGAMRQPEGRQRTPGEGREDASHYASVRAPQQTDQDQQTGTQQTAHQDDGDSKTSKHPSSDATNLHMPPEQPRRALYSALVSQRMSDLSRLFHDEEHQRSNRTRALRLWAGSDLDEQTFLDMMQEARVITMKCGNIEKEAGDGGGGGAYVGTKNRMPYFFAVLEDIVDMARELGGMPRRATGDGVHPRTDSADPAAARDAPGAAAWDGGTDADGGVQARMVCEPDAAEESVRADGDGVWGEVLRELELVITRENYNTWLRSTYTLARLGNLLRIAVPTAFHKSWLDTRLRQRVLRTLDRLGYSELQIDFVVAPNDAAGLEGWAGRQRGRTDPPGTGGAQ